MKRLLGQPITNPNYAQASGNKCRQCPQSRVYKQTDVHINHVTYKSVWENCIIFPEKNRAYTRLLIPKFYVQHLSTLVDILGKLEKLLLKIGSLAVDIWLKVN